MKVVAPETKSISLNLFGTIPFPPVVISFRSSTLSRQKFFDTSNLLQPSAFIPEGPVAHFVRREAVAMVASPMLSKMTGSQKDISSFIRMFLFASFSRHVCPPRGK